MKKTAVIILSKNKDVCDLMLSLTEYGGTLLEKHKKSTWMYVDRNNAEETLYLWAFKVSFPSIAKAKRYAKEVCDGFYKRSSIANKFRSEEYGTTNVTYYKGGEVCRQKIRQ